MGTVLATSRVVFCYIGKNVSNVNDIDGKQRQADFRFGLQTDVRGDRGHFVRGRNKEEDNTD